MTYAPETTTLLLVDPYNDFLSEGGKTWPRVKEVAAQVHLCSTICAPSSPQRGKRASRWSSFRTVGMSPMTTSCGATPYQRAGAQRQIFEKGTWGGTFHDDFQLQEGDIVAHEHWGSSGFANTDLSSSRRPASRASSWWA